MHHSCLLTDEQMRLESKQGACIVNGMQTTETTDKKRPYDVIVIGGGPAGMMAAGRAAELGRQVLLLEKNSRPGEKLLITGGGRSNITNNELDDRKLLTKFGKNAKFLFSPFAQFSVRESLDFFHQHGMGTKLEDEGRVFPATERAETVWQTLRMYMKEGGVVVRTNAEVVGFTMKAGEICGVKLKNGETLKAQAYILATGGTSRPETGSTGDGFKWLAKLGHDVRMPSAALTPIRVKESWAHKLAGLALKDVRVTILQNGTQHGVGVGKMLFTHVGLSGPLILNMSRSIGELLKYGAVTLTIDLFPKMDNGTCDRYVQDIFKKNQNKLLKNVLDEITPSTLAKLLPVILKQDGNKEVNKVSRDERLAIVNFLKSIQLSPTGLLGVEKAVVVSGGIALTEIDVRTMCSRLHSNLHVVGDVLDIDRPSGGYSLQLCWTTGWVAGTHAATTREGVQNKMPPNRG